jgi:murein DD-endopeptidase MepM/ murein hydrolase activator NlpD
MKKLVNQKSLGGLLFVIVILITILYNSYSKIKSQKIELNNQQNHIESIIEENKIIIEDNQILMCDNERLYMILDSLPLGSPITDTIKISSKYGSRRNPLGKGWSFHSGIDIFAAWSDTVFASGNGIVKKAHWFGGYGRCIVIAHIGGYESYYAHLYKIYVEEGDSIKKGQPLGRAGNSGAVTGPHLHYEIRRGEETANPLDFMDFLIEGDDFPEE